MIVSTQNGGVRYASSFDIVPCIGTLCCSRMLLNIQDVMALSDLYEDRKVTDDIAMNVSASAMTTTFGNHPYTAPAP